MLIKDIQQDQLFNIITRIHILLKDVVFISGDKDMAETAWSILWTSCQTFAMEECTPKTIYLNSTWKKIMEFLKRYFTSDTKLPYRERAFEIYEQMQNIEANRKYTK